MLVPTLPKGSWVFRCVKASKQNKTSRLPLIDWLMKRRNIIYLYYNMVVSSK
ncbi:hypothetical protein BF32_5473 (plasmid) [Bacillus thuringiensis]|uniref:Uncharacterized protein n=1 Tax=Bacillus cereus 03BB108 TaxID=451709 RepID=A0AAN0SRF6_BACCE|nr:hypothetical protein BF32_5473 [Bacillus thuringiensis]AJI08632.1 hypothetical protein AK40_6188 [Bacillus cereus 03BB108]